MAHLLLASVLLSGLFVPTEEPLDSFNSRIAGHVVDYTHNHGSDRRRCSAILGEKRDLYVYLPPGYTGDRQYPLILWLHGAFGDETPFARTAAIEALDHKIQQGCFPPAIVAAPDATIGGENELLARNSMFINGVSGRYEDHLICEVLPFLHACYSIRPEPDAHALCGYSGGGLPAMMLAIKHRPTFGIVTVVAGPLNLRYTTYQDRYFEDFDPRTYRWATEYNPHRKVMRYVGGLLHVPAKFFIHPIFGRGDDVIQRVKNNNPADLIFSRELQPGDLKIYLRCGDRDNFNFDAQMASFAHFLRCRGIALTHLVDPGEKHSSEYCTRAQVRAYDWLAQQLLPPSEPIREAEQSVPTIIVGESAPSDSESVATSQDRDLR